MKSERYGRNKNKILKLVGYWERKVSMELAKDPTLHCLLLHREID